MQIQNSIWYIVITAGSNVILSPPNLFQFLLGVTRKLVHWLHPTRTFMTLVFAMQSYFDPARRKTITTHSNKYFQIHFSLYLPILIYHKTNLAKREDFCFKAQDYLAFQKSGQKAQNCHLTNIGPPTIHQLARGFSIFLTQSKRTYIKSQ